MESLTKVQMLSCDMAWYKHRLGLLKEKRTMLVSRGTVEGWRAAQTVAESIKNVQCKIADLTIQIHFAKKAQ